MRAWTISTREEVISALWFIAAILLHNGGHVTLAWIVAVKAGLDLATCILLAIIFRGRQ